MQLQNVRTNLRVDEVISASESHLIPAPKLALAQVRKSLEARNHVHMIIEVSFASNVHHTP